MTQTYRLKHPIVQRSRRSGDDVREDLIEEVTVRRPKAKDLRLLDKHDGKIGQSLALIGALTGLLPPVVDELDGEDMEALGEIVGDFFPGRQDTGGSFSAT